MQLERIPIVYRAPFGQDGFYFGERRPGHSILEIVRSIPELPAHFMRCGYVCINGEVVPRELWAHVRPKPPRHELHIAVTLHMSLQTGGGDTGGRSTTKSIIGIVAAIALVIVTQGIASGAFLGTLGSIGVGGATITGAQVLAGVVGIAGALAISALTAPPTQALSDNVGDNQNQIEAAGAQANILDKSGAIPRVIGTRKIFPPFACEPVVELVEQDEYVEALFVLNGPHAINDIRIENNSVTAAGDVQLQVKEGWPTDTANALVVRQGKTTTPQLELSQHVLSSNGIALAHPVFTTDDIPVRHGLASRHTPDEIWIHILFPGGINGTTAANALGRIPFRFRFRRKGSATWINLPEFHVSGQSTNQFRGAIILKFNTAGPALPTPPTTGFDYMHASPPTQSSPASPSAWVAHTYFWNGTGNPYSFNGSSTGIAHAALFTNRIEVYLDPAGFPAGTFDPGLYEMEIIRGYYVVDQFFNKAAYLFSGAAGNFVHDFFYYVIIGGVPSIDAGHNNISDRCLVTRVISIWNDPPLTTPGNFALIAMKARNRTVRQVSCYASGYVPDWDGSSWNTALPWVTTSNPAPHYAFVLSGMLNLDPLPDDLRGDGTLVTWRQKCIDNDWTCDAIINDMRTQDVLNLIASCGYARPYQSDRYRVAIDDDVSLDSPVQIFSRRNCANLRFERAFARVPAGFNVTYRDESLDDDQAQLVVMQSDPSNTDMTLLESVTYDGLINADKVTVRAQFDLDQANLRSTFYYLEVDIESLVCRRGDLVGVEHDILSNVAGEGYIVSKQTSGGNITGVTLDAEVPVVAGTTGAVIRHNDGTLSTHQISNGTGNWTVITFTTPFADTAAIQGFTDTDRRYGCLVVVGDLTSIYRRLLVQSITPSANLTAQMVMVDEAPSLVRFAGGGGGSPPPAALFPTLDPLHTKGANVVLTNGNLTATLGSTVQVGATSIDGVKVAGKWYMEWNLGSNFDSGVGLGIRGAGSTYAGLWAANVQPFNAGAIIYTSGNVFKPANPGGANVGASGPAANSTLCVAVDIDNQLIWFRRNGGNWNGGSANDPAASVGGLTIADVACPGEGIYPCCLFGSVGTGATANFGASIFNQAIPSGYSAWDLTNRGTVHVDVGGVGSNITTSATSTGMNVSCWAGDYGGQRKIVVLVAIEKNGGAPTVTSVTATGLTFTAVGTAFTFSDGTRNGRIEIWEASSNVAFVNTAVTVNYSAAPDAAWVCGFSAYALSNGILNWDANSSWTGSAVSATPSISVSTASSTGMWVAAWASIRSSAATGPQFPADVSKLATLFENTAAVNDLWGIVSAKGYTSQLVASNVNAGTMTSMIWGGRVAALTG